MCLHIILLIVFNLLKYSRCEECVLRDSTSLESAWDSKIHKDKMLHYSYTIPPATNESCVPVKVQLQMKSFAIDEYNGKFIANLWTRFYWKDERFTWSPEEYGGVDKIVVHNSEIWLPSIRLLNSADEDYYPMDYGECRIKYDGEVLCVPKLVYEAYCTAKLKDWPYDVQNCTLQFGNNGINDVSKFNFAGRAIVLFPAEYGNGWNIMAMESKENLNKDVQLSISLIMERQAEGLVVVLVVPCFIVCILTSISTLLNVYDTARCGLLYFSLMSHFVFITAITEFLPRHSSDTPVILLFLRSSLILTINSILFTYILSKIVKRKAVPFAWVSIISTKVFDSFGQYLIVPRWDVTVENEDVILKNKVWNNFGNILNSVYLVIIVIVYISLFSEYMPELPPNEY